MTGTTTTAETLDFRTLTEQAASRQRPQFGDGAQIICDNLVKIYKIAELEVVALQGLDLIVEQGELIAIVGASGSGKSTLMNILGGLDVPSAGRAEVLGASVALLVLVRPVAQVLLLLALAPLVASRTWPGRIRSTTAFVLAAGLPLLAWTIVGHVATGGTMHNRNYLNVALDIYARNATWDVFWADAGQRFHSWLDVLTLDPARVASVLGSNAALRWYDDIRHLVPVWIGVPAVVGMLLRYRTVTA